MIEFPQFRKLNNSSVFYKIDSNRAFTEVKIMGKYYFVNAIEAKQFPEINYINDLLNLEFGDWQIITQEEYEHFLNECEKKLTKAAF